MEIKPYEKNAKQHPKKQVELIAKSIARFGWQQPIKVGKDNVILAGHGRYQAYQEYKDKLEMKEPWIINEEGKTISGEAETRKLTEQEEKAYRLADNQINALSDNDMGLVIEELKILDEVLIDLTGFDKDLIIEPDEADDEVPDVPEEPQSKLGDLYELGNHRVLCGDSTKLEDVERLMDGKKADMVFTDPPYGVEYEGRKKFDVLLGDSRDESLDFLSDASTNIIVNTKAGGAFYMCVGWPTISKFLNILEQNTDLNLSTKLVWVKNTIGWGFADYRTRSEVILYGFKNGAKHYWSGSRAEQNVWEFPKDNGKEYKHPTQKPTALIIKAITNSSKGDDIVMDLFLGSGSTLIASEKTGRICYGMEIDPRYCDVIVDRWCKFTGITDIKKNGEPYKWELQEDKK